MAVVAAPAETFRSDAAPVLSSHQLTPTTASLGPCLFFSAASSVPPAAAAVVPSPVRTLKLVPGTVLSSAGSLQAAGPLVLRAASVSLQDLALSGKASC
jgi:hypothetical protein